MRAPTKRDAAAAFGQAVDDEIKNPRGIAAWGAFLWAHASLMRRLDADLRLQTGTGINEFDVLATLALRGGSLRMTELAERAYSSRSGMTRRVDHLVEQGLISRGSDQTDGRGVVVALTGAGVKRLRELAPVHSRGIRDMFVSQLDDKDLDALIKALAKVTVDTKFG